MEGNEQIPSPTATAYCTHHVWEIADRQSSQAKVARPPALPIRRMRKTLTRRLAHYVASVWKKRSGKATAPPGESAVRGASSTAKARNPMYANAPTGSLHFDLTSRHSSLASSVKWTANRRCLGNASTNSPMPLCEMSRVTAASGSPTTSSAVSTGCKMAGVTSDRRGSLRLSTPGAACVDRAWRSANRSISCQASNDIRPTRWNRVT